MCTYVQCASLIIAKGYKMNSRALHQVALVYNHNNNNNDIIMSINQCYRIYPYVCIIIALHSYNRNFRIELTRLIVLQIIQSLGT